MTDIEYAADTKELPDTHFAPSMVGSHCAAIGVHWKMLYMKIAVDQMVTTMMLI